MANDRNGNSHKGGSYGTSLVTSHDPVMTAGAKARSAFRWLAMTNIVWQTLSWGFTLATIRFLKPSDYGLFSLAETVVPYLLLISQLNLTTWMVRVQDLTKHSQRTMFSLTVALGGIVSLLTLLLAPYLADFYGTEDLKALVQVIAVIFLLQGIYSVPFSTLQRELRFKSIAVMDLVLNVMRAMLTLLLAIAGMGYWALAVGLLFKELGKAVWLFALGGIPRGFGWDPHVFREALAFGLPATGATIFWIISGTADNIIVGKLLGVEILGYYAMAYFLMEQPLSKLTTVIRPVLVPYLSRLQKHPEDMIKAFLSINKAFVFLASPILIGVAVVAKEAVPLILGDKWTPMIQPLIAMSLFGVIYSITDNVSPFLHALGQPKKEFLVSLASAALLPISFLLLCREFGLTGVIATWYLVFPVISMLLLRAVRQAVGLNAIRYIKSLMMPLAAAGAMGILTSLCGAALESHLLPVGLLLAKIGIGVSCYLAVLWLFFRQESLELLAILRIKTSGN